MTATIIAFPSPVPSWERDWPHAGLHKARGLTTDELKALWDSYDGINTADPEIDGETVHYLLNTRGEGTYCAV